MSKLSIFIRELTKSRAEKEQELLDQRKREAEGDWCAHPPSWFEVRRPLQPNVGLARDFVNDPDQLDGVRPHFRPLLDDPAVHEAIQRDEVPIPALEDREGYSENLDLQYWLAGYDDLRVIRNHVPADALKHVLDFGGASGRFARQIPLADPAARVTVADLNINPVAWIEQFCGPSVRAVKVSPFPHFPLQDGSVTLCVGLSVFTHIDAYESGWLAEIHRVLAEGGYAFLTIHSEYTWPLLTNPDYAELLKKIRTSLAYEVEGCSLDRPLPAERMVFAYQTQSIEHNCNVFVHSDYVRRVWGRWFEVVDILPQAHHGFQTAVVLRKRSEASAPATRVGESVRQTAPTAMANGGAPHWRENT